MSRLDFRLLGPLQVLSNGVPLALGGPKQRAVLALLLINRNLSLSKRTIAEEVWAGSPPESNQSIIPVNISSLRGVLSAGGADREQYLQTTTAGYRLSVPDSDVDLVRYKAAQEEGNCAREKGRHEDAAEAFGLALEEFRGDPLDDLIEFGFASSFATAMKEVKLGITLDRIDADLACGRHRALVGELRSLTGTRPLDERLCRRLMVALYHDGRSDEALNAYRELYVRLDVERGEEPDAITKSLQVDILNGRSVSYVYAPLTDTPPSQGDASALDTIGDEVDERPVAALMLLDGGRRQIQSSRFRIGRDGRSDLKIEDAKVSREHAVISYEDCRYVIHDLQSRNHTWVNDQRVTSSYVLADGDVIRLGRTSFTFRLS